MAAENFEFRLFETLQNCSILLLFCYGHTFPIVEGNFEIRLFETPPELLNATTVL